ncbi:MAG: MG2 domain-containing protein [Gemmataceae bacterium]|nr:MG2 domain-containing protein [Gemmataceae bacterium]
MFRVHVWLAGIVVLGSAHLARGQNPGAKVETTLAQAQRLVEQKPSAARWLGLAELRRGAGQQQQALADLARAVEAAGAGAQAVELQGLLCWRMLPLTESRRPAFRQALARLQKIAPTSPWLPIYELYHAAQQRDRTALRAAVARLPARLPERFPASIGEPAHLDLLQAIGRRRSHAAVEVLAARAYEPLHALRDLDRGLTREGDFLRSQGHADEGRTVLEVRDRLRHAYLDAARNVVERLFALRLLGRFEQRDALLAQVKALPYLTDRQKLAELFDQLDEERAWTILLQPLLAGEVAVVNDPPDLAAAQASGSATLHVRARTKAIQGASATYEGAVEVTLGPLQMRCERLTVLRPEGQGGVLLTGTGAVRVEGVPFNPLIRAERFTYSSDTGGFSFGGDVRLEQGASVLKLTACSVTRTGEVRDRRSLLNEFRSALDINAKLKLLPAVGRVYSDDELPPDVRYLLALHLLRPHLTWHAPYVAPLPDENRREVADREAKHYREPWREAMGGEPWMARDVPESVRAAYQQALHGMKGAGKEQERLRKPAAAFFWRVRDPQHPDLKRVRELLGGVRGELEGQARHWLAEIGRNNTALTFDVPGGGSAGKPFPMLLDVRNGDQVALKLYCVENPEALLWVLDRIGEDFVYRDHGLQYLGLLRERGRILESVKKAVEFLAREGRSRHGPAPDFRPEKVLRQWEVRVSDLKILPVDLMECGWRERYRWWDSEDEDGSYFDDGCEYFQSRLDRSYRPRPGQPSSWQCDRILEVPGDALKQTGAYILRAECNGQVVYAPIVIDPLSLTLRRCRDGVFVLASDSEGIKPLAGAHIHAREMLGKTVTDSQGAAFARVFASGERAIVLHHEGRFAVGGFGRLFDGIYVSLLERQRWGDYLVRARKELERARQDASLYADRHVLAAYTDRPTYRPGQDVHFKLIVRKLASEPDASADQKPQAFRAQDFDEPLNLSLPDTSKPLPYTVLAPNGHIVASGTLKLSDFGTAAGTVTLNGEAPTGTYGLRVQVGGRARIVPEVFAVKHYRRPGFEVDLAGVPAKLTQPRDLTLTISGRYYFGKPVVAGHAQVRLVRADRWRSIDDADGRLDEKGTTQLTLSLPRHLSAGKYAVVCTLTDDSGRAVSTVHPLELVSTATPAGPGLADVPRFVAVGQELVIPTTARELVAEQDKTTLRFPAVKGTAKALFPAPGWYRLTAGAQKVDVFAYGGDKHPLSLPRKDQDKDEPAEVREPGWVNLSDYGWQEHGDLARCEDPAGHLFALFDRQQVTVGEKLRLLVFVPQGSARLLFTFEGRTVMDYLVLETPKGAGRYQIVELPIKPRHFPAFYLQGRIVSGQGEIKRPPLADRMRELGLARDDDEGVDPRWCRIDVIDPRRKPGEEQLRVAVEIDRTQYRPSEQVKVRLKVTDRQGQPQRAEVSLGAVDESVYTFGEDSLGGLARFFGTTHEPPSYLPKAWRSSLGNRWRRLEEARSGKGAAQLQDLQRMMKAQSEARAGQDSAMKQLTSLTDSNRPVALARLGGELPVSTIPAARLRADFRETATWQPQLLTGPDGVAETTFRLPDSLTRYRLSAVALTKTSEVGVGRARLRVALPLAVQLNLPRFAVEKDRLLAVALLHNDTDRERTCEVRWEVGGATLDGVSALNDWKTTGEGKGTGRVTVPARGTARVGVWLRIDQVVPVTVACHAGDGEVSDAETRSLPVQPLGREREVASNGALTPAAKPGQPQEKQIDLPAGFLARDLWVSVASSSEAQALEGLGYLVDYPYGCIEQTMSRFLPAVMVAHATQQTATELPPDVAAKLPAVLAKGLTRVYSFQHPDGSWGWFDQDDRNDPMTVYVVYGLARCRTTGTPVDKVVLERGCSYLRRQLSEGRLTGEIGGWAWYALALADQANVKELDTWIRQRWAEFTPEARCYLALACRSAGLHEMGERLWAAVRGWQPAGTDRLSLFLNTQIAYGAAWDDCRRSSQQLLALRHGDRWEHTRATSWAIEALSQLLAYAPERRAAARVSVEVGGQRVLDVTNPVELRKLVHRLHLPAGGLPRREGLTIRITADGPELMHFTLRTTGIQRLDEIAPTGKGIKLLRHLETVEGKPLTGPVKVGQVIRVRLQLELEQEERYLIVEDRRPAGCEFADERLEGKVSRNAAHVDWRDDRVSMFFASLPAGRHEIVYYLRAETPGVSHLLPGCAYPMYREKDRGETAAARVQVKDGVR